MAMFSAKQSDRDVANRVLEIASRMEVPLARENLNVHRAGGITYVDATYVAQLEYFPRQFYPWEFKVDVRAQAPRYQLP
jgi:hypothetical protein